MISDTPKAVGDLQCRLLAEAGFNRRLSLSLSLSSFTRALSMQGIRGAHPEWSEQECKVFFCSAIYGDALGAAVRSILVPEKG